LIARISLILTLAVLLAACAASRPAPVEDRDTSHSRVPDAEAKQGVQVFPLRNPAVVQLTDDAKAAEKAGHLDQSASLLERALRIQPRDPQLLQNMAEVQLQKQDYQQALSFAVRSWEIGPRVGEICVRNWRTIGAAKRYLGDRDGSVDADRHLDECIKKRPEKL